MIDTRLRRDFDLPLLAFTYCIALLSVLILWSATRGDPTAYEKKQLIGIMLGTGALAIMTFFDYHQWTKFAPHLYTANLILLLIVRFKGHDTNGSTRWIKVLGFQFQPSEFAKIIAILTLGAFLMKRQETIKESKTVLHSLLYVSAPAFLILKQPDLGTSLVVYAIWFGMMYLAGAQIKHLACVLVAGLALFSIGWKAGAINDYQKKRLIIFIDPSADPKGAGYHVSQARIAIGSGGMWGKGLSQSTQVRNGYIPEKTTDFIFTTVGEEFGFVGSVFLLFLYGGLLYRGVTIAASAEEDYLGRVMAAGVISMIGFHVVVNVGMNVGIIPVAGVPLPMVSAGNSSMIVTLASVGLLVSIVRHRHQLMFG